MQRLRGIDGLKGLSMLAILGYHLFQQWLPGGFVGIEVFFTISGYLTARSLLNRLNANGSIDVKNYYVKRARRIIPAAWFMAIFIIAVAWIVRASDALVGIRSQLFSIFTFTYNWHDINVGTNYFAQTGPELFKHLWFISVLVQFYIIVPLIVWFFWRFWSTKRASIALLVVAFASAIAMGAIYSDSDPTRVYFGTDTHFFGLLIGVALAFMLADWAEDTFDTTSNRLEQGNSTTRFLYSFFAFLGALSLVIIAYLTIAVIRQDDTAFRGGLLLVALLTALCIVGLIVPSSWSGKLLDFKPLSALGKYSYGIYLWHWPINTIILFLIPQWRSTAVPYAALLTLALTALTTWGSYKLIESPVVRKGFKGTLLPDSSSDHSGWLTWAISAVLVVVSVVGCVRGVQSAPTETQTQKILEENEKLQEQEKQKAEAKKNASDLVKSTIPDPVRVMPSGDRISAIGDSVMLASQPALIAEFPGINVDAAVSRSMFAGISLAQSQDAARNLRQYVLVGLGTNTMVTTDQLDQLLGILGKGRVMVLINAHGDRSWIPPTNAVLAQYAQDHSDQVVLVDWNAVASANEGSLYSDGIHPVAGKGDKLYVNAIKEALNKWIQSH